MTAAACSAGVGFPAVFPEERGLRLRVFPQRFAVCRLPKGAGADAVAAVDGMIAASLGAVGKLAAAVATAWRPTGAARALVSFVRTRTPIARPGSHAFPSRRYLTT